MPPPEAPDWRLFIALPLPAVAAEAVGQALLPYAAAFPKARWQPAESLHVTLRFLGATPIDAIAAIESTVDSLTLGAGGEGAAPLEIATARGAGRARGADGVAWLTIGRGQDIAAGLARRLSSLLSVEPALAEAVARPLPEPHLTVARRADWPLIEALMSRALGPLEVAWHADRICLFRSHPSRGGATYESLHEARLVGAA